MMADRFVTGRMRAGDKERDECVEVLRKAYSEGYLSSKEFDERVDSAMSAKYSDDLIPLTLDLPYANSKKSSKIVAKNQNFHASNIPVVKQVVEIPDFLLGSAFVVSIPLMLYFALSLRVLFPILAIAFFIIVVKTIQNNK